MRAATLLAALAIALADDSIFETRLGYVVPRTFPSLNISAHRVNHIAMSGALAGICVVAVHQPPQNLCPITFLFLLRGQQAFLDDEKLFKAISLDNTLASKGLAEWRTINLDHPVPATGAVKNLLEVICGAQVSLCADVRVTHRSSPLFS